jgi:hypothetical protein
VKLEDLKERQRELAVELSAVQKEIHELECLSLGLHVGGIVLYLGKEYKIVKIETFANPPWVTGVPRKKDGTWGIGHRNLFGAWRKP